MTRKVLLAAVLLILPFVAQGQVKLLRHPSYSKGRVAFSYLGDIWTANENGSDVQRVTDHKARDVYPRYSPDGTMIAFSSNREGNYDVYVVPATGGKPRQLTFHSASDTVVGWTPDGKRIVFSSSRGKGAFPTVATLWSVSVDGGPEQPIDTDWGSYASYNADGSRMAFSRHPGVWSRRHYRGSYAVDLWIMDVAAKKFTQLGDPDYKGNYLWPMYGRDGYIYYVADQTAAEKNIVFGGPEVMKSVNNIWKISEKGGKPVQVTKHGDGNLYFPSISADGKIIVYEDNFGLWKLDVASGRSTEIRVDVKSDIKDNEKQIVTFANEAEAFHISPSNRRAAVEAHGEIFTVATDRGEPQRVTETPWNDQNPRWSPDGKWIAFVSDRTGREEVWISDEPGKTAKKLSDADCDKSAIVWGADSKFLLWNGSDHKLRRVEIESGKTDVVAAGEVTNISGPQISPDGKWLMYSTEDRLLRSHIYIKPFDGPGEPRAILSDQFLIARGAKWTPDGKKIVFVAGFGAPSMASTNRTTMSLWSLALTKIEKDPDEGRDINSEAQAETATPDAAAAGRGGRGAGMGAAAPARVEVKIDWDGVDRRFKQLTTMQVSGVYPSPDSRTYLFSASGAGAAGGRGAAGDAAGGPGLYTMAEDGTRITRLNTTVQSDAAGGGRGRGGFGGGFGGAEPQWSRDGRSIYFGAGGGIYNLAVTPAPADSGSAPAVASTGGRGGRGGAASAASTATASAGAGPAPRRINFTVRMEVDLAAERKQVFGEAWRVMKNRFYDAKMHGVNWAAAKDRYEPLLEHIVDTEELQNVVMEMIGELNASHTGISGGGGFPGQRAEIERVQTRYPGFDLEPDASGYYRVSYIYKKGPADRDYIKLSTGNFVLSVNGKDLKTTDNYWQVFNVLPGRKLEFVVNSKPAADGAWKFSVDPMTSAQMGDLQYELWVDSREEMTRKLTNGQIGYLHIRAMDAPSLEKFQRDLLINQDKKALIIDQRFNGGGGIDQELLGILMQRKEYQYTVNRDSVKAPRPGQTFFGPMVVLQNERSASDAEMFPQGFKDLGLGKTIGMPTYGAVIGTGSFRLLDGSSIRTPGSGVYTATGKNLENYGVPPDVVIDNGPSDYLGGHDRQIEKAIEVLTAQIK